MSPTRRTFGALRVKSASTATTAVNTGAVVANCGRYKLVLEVSFGQSTRSNVCLTQNVGIVGCQKLTVSELVCSETRQRQVLYFRLMVLVSLRCVDLETQRLAAIEEEHLIRATYSLLCFERHSAGGLFRHLICKANKTIYH